MNTAGTGVLLIIMTNFASLQANSKNKIKKQNKKPPPSHDHIPKNQQHKISTKNQRHHERPAPYNKLTLEL